jgi:broad-specificity NMP kinase
MKNWYAWLIEQSFDSKEIFDTYKTVKMKEESEMWTEHIIEVPEDKVEEAVKWMEEHILPSWYAHLVQENNVIVIYHGKTFRLKSGDLFDEVRQYGRDQKILEEQLPSEALFKLARDSGY